MKLESIGFYTLSDERAAKASGTSRLQRCEVILTSRCNFNCPYCRHVGGSDMDLYDVSELVVKWAQDGLRAIRFSGGEPTVYKGLKFLVELSKKLGIEKIAISTNGSASIEYYEDLIAAGVNDFSISLDACCADDGDHMAGGVKGAWEKVVKNIRLLSQKTYVTVGIVLTGDNIARTNDIIKFADSLGVQDIRVIPAAQDGDKLTNIAVDQDILERHPILAYRVANIKANNPVRGLKDSDCNHCGLVMDDMAVNADLHYPCIIYMREGGMPIGKTNQSIEEIRAERVEWALTHDTHADPICKKNCLDVCIAYNNRFNEFNAIPLTVLTTK
jgi:MoaA/NifB/PqqE/SkfB family radical SAM enzyme